MCVKEDDIAEEEDLITDEIQRYLSARHRQTYHKAAGEVLRGMRHC